MGFLLDTCVVIWYFNGNEKLPPAIVAKLRDPQNEVFVSDASIFEMVIKYSLGKLPFKKPPSWWMDPLIGRHGLTKLPVDTAAIYGLEKLPLLHRVRSTGYS
jgi:PIN domain nuclease of toxin-antitoxin system